MRFPPEILDDIRARLPISQVVAKRVALKRAGREFRGLSPFKTEKSPSFFVNDQKAFYHCFASGEHGDIFTFLMKTEGLSFPEAVERLAAEAGVSLPQPSAGEVQRQDGRVRLYALLDEACRFFQDCLGRGVGSEARAYVERRGLQRAAIDRFRLGYAPNSRHALKDHLAAKGYTLDEMVTTGMLIAGDDIPVAYDRFRHRVIFPIGDAKGRIIAFGGRALDPDAPAKYLNSPETPLFHKGGILYNAHLARPAAFDRNRVIAVEGYMDVVALSEAGFAESVAPLGTALTEDQARLLWRMSPEPVLCFDGDGAGRKAAFRALDTMLPHLAPGQSALFAFLPDGLDPDDLVRQQGPDAMETVLSRARPFADVLWDREWGAGTWTTPERRAQLERQVFALVGRIGDGSVRRHYERDMRRRLGEVWGAMASAPAGRGGGAGGWRNGRAAGGSREPGERYERPSAARAGSHAGGYSGGYSGGRSTGQGGDGSRWSARSQQGAWRGEQRGTGRGPFSPFGRPGPSAALLGSGIVAGEAAAPPYREALLLRTVMNHPWLLDEWAEAVAALPLSSLALERLRDAILSLHVTENSLDTGTLRSQLTAGGLGKVVSLVERTITHKSDRFSEPDADTTEVDAGWRHALALHERQSGLVKSLAAAERAYQADFSEDAWARICEIKQVLAHMESIEADGDGSS